MPSLKRSVGRKGRRVCFGRNEVLLTVRTSWEMRLQILLDLCALKLPGKERPTCGHKYLHTGSGGWVAVCRGQQELCPQSPGGQGALGEGGLEEGRLEEELEEGPGGGEAGGGGAGGGEAGGGGAGGGGAGGGQEEGRWSLLQLCAHSRYAIDLFNM